MNSPQYIPSFYFYKFAQGISEPYTSLNAYKAGAVDASGNILKAESSIDPLEYLIIKLKKIFEELPSGLTKAKLGNYMSTMQLFGEEVKAIGITDAEYTGLVEGYIAVNIDPSISYVELLGEDMGAGGMGVAASSPAYNQGSVSGYDPAMGTMRRNKPVQTGFDACEMFDVCPEEMTQFKNAKAWKHVPDSETKRYLQRYQRRNPTGHMAVRSVDPESGKTEIHWVKLKPMSFMEEFKLDGLDILSETIVPKEQKNYEIDNPSDVADIFETMSSKLNPRISSDTDHSANLEYATRLAAGIHGLFSSNKFSKENHGGQSSHEKDFLNALGNVASKQKSTPDASSEGISDVVMFGKSGKIHAVDTKHRYDAKSAKGINISAVPGLRETLDKYFKTSSAQSIPSKEFQEHHKAIKDQIVADVESQKYPLGLGIYKRAAGLPDHEYGFHGAVIVTPKNRASVTDWVKSRPMSSRAAFVQKNPSGGISRFQPSVSELRSSEGMKKITGTSGAVEEHPDRLLVTDKMMRHLETRMGRKGAHLMPIIHYHLVRHGLYHPNPSTGEKEFDLDSAE